MILDRCPQCGKLLDLLRASHLEHRKLCPKPPQAGTRT